MRTGTLGLALLAAAWAAASVPVLAQEAGAGEVEIFLVGSKSPGADASFRVTSSTAIPDKGDEVALPVALAQFRSSSLQGKQVPALSGPLPSGLYRGLRLVLLRTGAPEGAPAAAPVEVKVSTDFRVWPGETTSLELLWSLPAALTDEGALSADAFALRQPGKVVRGLTLYFTDEIGNQVVAVNRADDRVFAMIPVGNRPRGIAFSPDGRRAYVANSGDDTITIIDALDHRVADTIVLKPGCAPLAVAVAMDGSRVVVSCAGSQSLVVLDPLRNAVIREVSVSRAPGRLAVGRGGRTVFALVPDSSQVVALDADAATLLGSPATVEAAPSDLAFDPVRGRLYVVHARSPVISVLTETLQVERRFQIGVPSTGLAIERGGGGLYLVNAETGGLTLVDTRVGTASRRLAIGQARRVVLDPDERRLYATGVSQGALYVVNKIAWRMIGKVQGGKSAHDLAIAP